MYVQFYNFAKDNDSTARPTGNGARFDCQLKQETNITAPVIILSVQSGNDEVTAYNYCYIPKFTRYYFIRDWQWIGGAWYISLSVDVLASFKTQIGKLNCYVERSTSAFDTTLIDLAYPTQANRDIIKIPFPEVSWANVSLAQGTYVLGVTSSSSHSLVGGVAYYALTATQLQSFINFLFSDSIYTSSNISEIGEGLYKSVFNPMQYVVSCMWYPFPLSAFTGTTETMKIGYWTVSSVTAKAISSLGTKASFFLDVDEVHPQSGNMGDFLNRYPYTQMTMFMPPFGMFPLDTNYTVRGQYLVTVMQVDYFTGVATGRFGWSDQTTDSNDADFFSEIETQFGVPIQLSQLSTEMNMAKATSLSGLAMAAVQDIGTALLGRSVGNNNGSAPKVSTVGSTGNFSSFNFTPFVMIEHICLAQDSPALMGKPLMQNRILENLSGYIKCAKADVKIACTEAEREEIKNHLMNGFFWE